MGGHTLPTAWDLAIDIWKPHLHCNLKEVLVL